MAIPTSMSEFRIIFFRSDYPLDPNAAGISPAKDERMVQVYDLLGKAGLDTQNSKKLAPTEKSLSSPEALEHLAPVARALENIPCAVLIRIKQEMSANVQNFCERLVRAYPNPFGEAPLIWFRESLGKPYLTFPGADGKPLHILTLPYRLIYTDADAVILKRFLLFRRPTPPAEEKDGEPITILPPPPEPTLKTKAVPDATIKAKALDSDPFLSILANRNKKKKDG